MTILTLLLIVMVMLLTVNNNKFYLSEQSENELDKLTKAGHLS